MASGPAFGWRTDACTLPDVRVTAEEREHAIQLARRLGLTFADFMRSAIRVVEELETSGALIVATTPRGKELMKAPSARNVRATYAE